MIFALQVLPSSITFLRCLPRAPQKIDQYFPFLEFFITLTGGFGASSQDYFASVTNTNTTVETSTVDLITATGTLTPAQDAVVRVRMACNTTGNDTVTLRIDLAGFDSILIAWTKLCVFNGTNAGFNVATADWTHTIEMGNVVREGSTLPLWQGDDTAGAGNFVLFNASVTEQKFFLWMYRGHQEYRIVADESDLDKVAVSLSATSGVATRQTPGGWTSNFTVTMQCLCDNCFGFVSVELQVDPYDPIAIAFFKDCTKSPAPPLPPPPPSWSSTAVAFFVYAITVYF